MHCAVTAFREYCDEINLHVEGRVSAEDAARQERTAREILFRLANQPGIVLADEVGMGKTFVALAVAVSVALSDRRPVVVMVPPSLRDKWPRDFQLFREKCLPPNLAEHLRWASAERAVEFLKLLDDPPRRRKQIIFVTHGAMSRGLSDSWVRLALIARAIRGRTGARELRSALARSVGELLWMKGFEKKRNHNEKLWLELMTAHPSEWLEILQGYGVDPERDNNPETDDDPVPSSVCRLLDRNDLDLDSLWEVLQQIPKRRGSSYHSRIRKARNAITDELRRVWRDCVGSLGIKLPLLILDEAHHLKNPHTKLAKLFHVPEAEADGDEIHRGPLGGVFERIMFLTATPFQLGHGELCSVLERFEGINWRCKNAPACGREGYSVQLKELRSKLDAAHEATSALDVHWGRLRTEDLHADGTVYPDSDTWWPAALTAEQLSPTAAHVARCYKRAHERMRAAESVLRPWVIRHSKARRLPEPYGGIDRRQKLIGSAIVNGGADSNGDGIAVSGNALLPFLLASRASSQTPENRPVFAEGLASSYEAFLHTRKTGNGAESMDGDDDDAGDIHMTDAMRWYLDQLERRLPKGDLASSVAHPKVAATVNRVLEIWRRGEKVVVFCHYIATGKILRQHLSRTVEGAIRVLGAQKLACPTDDVTDELDRIGRRFFDDDSPLRRACDFETQQLLQAYPTLAPYLTDLQDVVRRNVRTPSFLVRYFALDQERLDEDSVAQAFEAKDSSGLRLKDVFEHFFQFLVERCGETERERYIEAVKQVQTGSYRGADIARSFAGDELQGERMEMLSPLVRLVNGAVKSDTRQRLMLTFNTPFYPEILIASSVLAEGVDLHLNCRHIIHHDLCWNPSTLEQRTGRIDRIGAKAERCGQPIFVYLPFIAETQDEKMYRVVTDRERWFGVVMGEKYLVDSKSTDRLAGRIEFPDLAAKKLAFGLAVDTNCSKNRHVVRGTWNKAVTT